MDDVDPKGLIRESYRIDGISEAECRSIFLDWAISMPGTPAEVVTAVRRLADHYGAEAPGHPMTAVLREGLEGRSVAARRGGWRSRRAPALAGEPAEVIGGGPAPAR